MKSGRGLLFSLVLLFSGPVASGDGYLIAGVAHPVLSWDSCFVFVCDESVSSDAMAGYGQSLGTRGFFWEADVSKSIAQGRIDGERYRMTTAGLYAGWRSPSRFFFTARAGLAYSDIDGPDGHEVSGSRTRPAVAVGFGVRKWTILEHRRFDDGINLLLTSYRHDW